MSTLFFNWFPAHCSHFVTIGQSCLSCFLLFQVLAISSANQLSDMQAVFIFSSNSENISLLFPWFHWLGLHNMVKEKAFCNYFLFYFFYLFTVWRMCLYQRNTSCCFVTQFTFIEILQLNNVYLARGRIVILTIFQLIFTAPPLINRWTTSTIWKRGAKASGPKSIY